VRPVAQHAQVDAGRYAGRSMEIALYGLPWLLCGC
jgi:hypothetical protein